MLVQWALFLVVAVDLQRPILDVRPPPSRPNFLHFYAFSGKYSQIIGWDPPFGFTPSGKS